MLRDPVRDLADTADHEAAHAVAFVHYGARILAIDIARPEQGVGGHVKCAPEPRLSDLQQCVVSRIGGLAAGQDWLGVECATDREKVWLLCPARFSLKEDVWTAIITLRAQALLDQPDFRRAVKALGRALLDRPHKALEGPVAHEIIAAAISAGFDW